MKRFGLIGAALLALAVCAGAWETDFKDTDKTGRLNVHPERGAFLFNGTAVTATAAELNIIDGVTATTAELNAAADLSSRSVSVSVTNGQAVTLSASTPVITVTGIKGANNSTNTITLARPYPVNQTFTIIVGSASTNLISIADSTTVLALGAAWLAGPTDTLTIYTTATNAAVKITASDN